MGTMFSKGLEHTVVIIAVSENEKLSIHYQNAGLSNFECTDLYSIPSPQRDGVEGRGIGFIDTVKSENVHLTLLVRQAFFVSCYEFLELTLM